MIAVNCSAISKKRKTCCNKVNKPQKSEKNAEYLTKLNCSITDIEANRVITKTIDELEKMADE